MGISERRALLELEFPGARDFDDPTLEWRRLFAEFFGTFLLVLAGAGAVVVGAMSHGAVSQSAMAVAPGLMVTAIVLFMGAVSGAHLNPAVSVGFAVRGDFPWRRVPGYVLIQLCGAVAACLFLWLALGKQGALGSTEPGSGVTAWQAMLIELALTVGLVSTVLGTASKAQNIGPLSALGVGAYIALAGLWAGPISGASMNPARSFGPDLVRLDFANYWLYVVGPLAGAAVATAIARVLRGPGDATGAAQGVLGFRARWRHSRAGR
jgi:aquaporin Z